MKLYLVAVSILLAFAIPCIGKRSKRYTFIHEYVRIYDVNQQYGECTLQFYKFNRTAAVLNLTVTTYIDVETIEFHVEGYQFMSNEFRKGIIDFVLPFCDYLSGNKTDFDAANILGCGNTTVCPWKKGTTNHICNISPDASQFPPFVPPGRWSIRITFIFNGKLKAGILEWVVQIVDTVP